MYSMININITEKVRGDKLKRKKKDKKYREKIRQIR